MDALQLPVQNHPKSSSGFGSLPWIISAKWDVLWILNGLWFVPLFFIIFLKHDRIDEVLPFLLLTGIPHHMSALITTLSVRPLRQHALTEKKKFILYPLLIAAASMIIAMLAVYEGIREAQSGLDFKSHALLLAGAVYMIFDTYHFAAQHYGLLSLYRARLTGTEALDAKVDRYFAMGVMTIAMPFVWLVHPVQKKRYGSFSKWGLMKYVPHVSARYAVAAVLVVTVIVVARELRLRKKAGIPRALMLLNIGLIPCVALFMEPVFHYIMYSFSHWLTEIALCSKIVSEHHRQTRKWRFAPVVAFVGGVVALCLMSHASRFFCWSLPHPICQDNFPAIHLNIKSPADFLFLGVPLGISMAFLFNHFYFDRRIYKFSDRRIRAIVQPLIFARGETNVTSPPIAQPQPEAQRPAS